MPLIAALERKIRWEEIADNLSHSEDSWRQDPGSSPRISDWGRGKSPMVSCFVLFFFDL